MQDVDQDTGEDLNPSGLRRHDADAGALGLDADNSARNPDRPATAPLVDMPELDDASERKAIKRISSPERWEIKQMMAANVIDCSDLPEFDDETGLLPKEEENAGEIVCVWETRVFCDTVKNVFTVQSTW